jgi:Domain of unknown function (DUF4386)
MTAPPSRAGIGPGASLGRITGWLFVVAIVLFATAATVLSSTFDWPDILREPPSTVLTEFQRGGPTLVWTWFAVAWTYFLLLPPIVMLERVMADEAHRFLPVATLIGALSVLASTVGFLRWVFVVPGLAGSYTAAGATDVTREAVTAAYVAQHQFGGALLGEHVGQVLAIVWTVAVSVAMLRSRLFPPWLGWAGLAASLAYLLNQGDVLATAVPGFPVLEIAGLLGSTLWAVWLLLVGASLLRAPRA